MRIEVLYFPGCPNHVPAVDCVRAVLAQEDTLAEMVEIAVKDVATAQLTRFLGSPTVRVDGQDVEPAARVERAFGLSCRTYIYGGRRAGVPPLEWIRAAVREANSSRAVVTFDTREQSAESLSKFVATCGYKVKEPRWFDYARH